MSRHKTNLLRGFGWLILLVSMACLLGGWLGALHPLGDSLAVFRVPFAGLAIVAGFALRHDPRAALLGGLATLALLFNWIGHFPASISSAAAQEDRPLVLYHQNLLFQNKGNADFIASVLAEAPDVVTLAEVSKANLPVLEELRAAYPVQHFCPFRAVGGVAVLARDSTLLNRVDCQSDLGLALMEVERPEGVMWLAALHLPWPWPLEQAEHVERVAFTLAKARAEAPHPMVLAGDFNAVGWTEALARIAEAGGMARIGRFAATFDLPPMMYPIGIDHVLATGGQGEITVMPKFSSDHHGVLARIRMAREAE